MTDLQDMETKLRSLLRGQWSSLSISFNDHVSNYVTLEKAIEEGQYEHTDWISEEEKQKAIAENSAWEIRYYPDTPVGFISLSGSTLQSVIEAALKDE